MANWMRAVQVLGRRVGVRRRLMARREGERVVNIGKDGGFGVGIAVGATHPGWPPCVDHWSKGIQPLLMLAVPQRGAAGRVHASGVYPKSTFSHVLPGEACDGNRKFRFSTVRLGNMSPLAKAIFVVDGVVRVFFGADFVTVTKSDQVEWEVLNPEIFATITNFYSSKQPLFYDAAQSQASDTLINEDDDETVVMIKELLDSRIRPAVQDDGGDIEYRGVDP